jgi:hypothetical protein
MNEKELSNLISESNIDSKIDEDLRKKIYEYITDNYRIGKKDIIFKINTVSGLDKIIPLDDGKLQFSNEKIEIKFIEMWPEEPQKSINKKIKSKIPNILNKLIIKNYLIEKN